MKLFKEDLKRLPMLFLGLLILSLGIHLTKISGQGMSSWSVFHDGLSKIFNQSFGNMTFVVGLIILLFSMIFLKTKIGLGTIMNIVFVRIFLNGLDIIIPKAFDGVWYQILIMILGTILMTFGRSLYIASKLGAGPRDGLFVGLARVTKIDVKYVKPAIEYTILFIGFLLGGTIGVGTVLIILVSGYLVQFFFKVLKFDPKAENQSNIVDYLNLKKESQY